MNYYETLGVEKNADIKEIKRAYRKLANKYHPDKNVGDKNAEDKIKIINEAYETLSNPEKRKEYDREQSNPFKGGFEGGYTRRERTYSEEASDEQPDFSFTENFADIFADIFSTFSDIKSSFASGHTQESSPLGSGPEFEYSHIFKEKRDESYEEFAKRAKAERKEEKPTENIINVNVILTPEESMTGVIKEVNIPGFLKTLNIKFPKDAVPGKSLKIIKDGKTIHLNVKWNSYKYKFNEKSVEMNLKFDKAKEKVLIRTPFKKEYYIHLPKDIAVGDKVKLAGLGWQSEDESKKMDLYVNIIK